MWYFPYVELNTCEWKTKIYFLSLSFDFDRNLDYLYPPKKLIFSLQAHFFPFKILDEKYMQKWQTSCITSTYSMNKNTCNTSTYLPNVQAIKISLNITQLSQKSKPNFSTTNLIFKIISLAINLGCVWTQNATCINRGFSSCHRHVWCVCNKRSSFHNRFHIAINFNS